MKSVLEGSDKEPCLLYITGSGRSGSTMLDHLLSEHPLISSLGEVHRFSLSLRRSTQPHYCSCGKPLQICNFWKQVIEQVKKDLTPRTLEKLITTHPDNFLIPDTEDLANVHEPIPSGRASYGASLSKIILALHSSALSNFLSPIVPGLQIQKKIARDSRLLFRAVADVHGTKVVTDCTKTPGRLMALTQFGNFRNIHALYLVRNGLAVTAARMRRQGISMEKAARIWLYEHQKIEWSLRPLRSLGKVAEIKYEDLCENPQSILSYVSTVLPLDSRAEWGAHVAKGGYHGLGGNPMRWRSDEKAIILDNRWKNELTKNDLKVFSSIAGRKNRQLGYYD